MNDTQFHKICDLRDSDHSLLISFRDLSMTGKLLDCWQDNFLVEVHGKYLLWPKELCDVVRKDYPIPTYS